MRRITVMTHRRSAETGPALRTLMARARDAGVTLCFDAEETAKHRLEPAEGLEVDCSPRRDVELCVALGGDGTILNGLRAYADTGTPVFGVNFGQVGFLATVDPDGLEDAFDRAFSGDYEVIALPSIGAALDGRTWTAFNDVSVHRSPGKRVAELAYAFGGEEIGRVRCDGLVVATPQGSTGYNLANGGPVLAWGVEGFVVSFIAPHSLAARPLVVAPTDVITIANVSTEDGVELHVDGRPAAVVDAGAAVSVQYGGSRGRLALQGGTTFYHRLRERFGRLAM